MMEDLTMGNALVYYATDHEEDHRQVVEALAMRGLEVVLLTSLRELEKHLRRPSLRPRLVVLDDGPPHSTDWDGVETCRLLKRDPHIRSIPIILIGTDLKLATGPQGRRREAEEAGAVAFLEIPFRPEDLERTIRTTISQLPK